MKCNINSLVTLEMGAGPSANRENFYIKSQAFQVKPPINRSPANYPLSKKQSLPKSLQNYNRTTKCNNGMAFDIKVVNSTIKKRKSK